MPCGSLGCRQVPRGCQAGPGHCLFHSRDTPLGTFSVHSALRCCSSAGRPSRHPRVHAAPQAVRGLDSSLTRPAALGHQAPRQGVKAPQKGSTPPYDTLEHWAKQSRAVIGTITAQRTVAAGGEQGGVGGGTDPELQAFG